MSRAAGRAALAFAWLVAGCGGSKGGGTGPCTPGPATQLLKTGGGDPPPWYHNNLLPAPLSVTVKDANNCAVPGVVVSWAIVGGGDGAVNPAQSMTNSSGLATTADSVGSAPLQNVHVTSPGLPSLDFQVTSKTPGTTVGVALGGSFFNPADTAVQVGGTVTWTWNGIQHTLTFTNGPQPLPPETIQSTGTKAITFNTVGTYAYHCTIHAGMTGSLVVVH